jgi:hypothetical protein
MIAFARAMPAGNAVQIILSPPAGAVRWRVLRRLDAAFTGEADAGAVLIDDGREHAVMDVVGLTNGTTYYYRDYAQMEDGTWAAGAVATAVPAYSVTDSYDDVLVLVRDRLRMGLAAERAAGGFASTDPVAVLTAPPQFSETAWPVVTVHLANDAQAERGLGEYLDANFDADLGVWNDDEGWLSRVRLDIIVWALNPDQRIALRQAVRRVLQANLPVFDSRGIVQIEFSQSDVEDFQSYAALVYQTVFSFSCVAPQCVRSTTDDIEAVVLTEIISG